MVHNSNLTSLEATRLASESQKELLNPVMNFMKDLIRNDESIKINDIKFKSNNTIFADSALSLECDDAKLLLNKDTENEPKITDRIIEKNKDSFISRNILDIILKDADLSKESLANNDTKMENQKFKIIKDDSVTGKENTLVLSDQSKSQLDYFDDLSKMPSLKKRKIKKDILKDRRLPLIPTDIKNSTIYVNPDELKLNSLKQVISLVNDILSEEKILRSKPKLEYFEFVDDFDLSAILNNEVILKLEDCFTRLFGNFQDFNFDKEIYDNNIFSIHYISKVQSFCLSLIKYGLKIDFSQVVFEITEGEVDIIPKIMICENSLRSCLIMLMIFLSGREDKIIYFEDYMLSVVGFISNIMSDLVVPVVNISTLETNGSHSKDFSNRFQIIGNLLIQCLKKLDNYVNVDSIFPNRQFTSLLSDYVLTKLEYTCIAAIFSDIETERGSPNEFVNVFIHTCSQPIRNSAMNILLSIFRKYQNQRSFILDEILTNFGNRKAANHKDSSKQFKLSKHGINVQIFTVLILGLVQTYNVNNVSLKIPIWKHNDFIFKTTFHESLNTSLFIPDIHLGKIKLNSIEKPKLYKIMLDYQTYLSNEKSSLSMICNNISSFLIDKLSNNFDHSNKIHIESFIIDLLELLELPEWPGSETLLTMMMNTFMYVFTSSKYHANVETFFLEMIGLIGCKLAVLKKRIPSSEVWLPSTNITSSDFKNLSNKFDSCLSYVREISYENPFFLANFNFLLFKWVQTLELLKKQIINDGLSLESNKEEILKMDNDKAEDLTEELLNIKLQRNMEKRLLQQSELFRCVVDEYYKYLSLIGTKKGLILNKSLGQISVEKFETSKTSNISNTKPDILTDYLHVLVSQPLVNSYDQFLKLIIAALSHQKIKSRARAIKNLASIIKNDKSILLNQKIGAIIFDRVHDRSSLVRDAAIDLVCNFILSEDNNTENESTFEYLRLIINKITDQSLAVQRRVLKLAHQIYSRLKLRELKVLLIFNLLKIIHHEDASIIDTSAKILIDILFVPIYAESNKKDYNDLRITSVILKNAEILSDVIFSNNRKVWRLFQEFIDKYVFFNGSRGKSHRRKINFSLCHDDLISILEIYADKIVDCIIQHHNGTENNEMKIEKHFGLLSILISGCGKLINQDQLMLLLPYLNDDSSTGSNICFFTLNIFKNALPSAHSLRPNFIHASQQSLLKRLSRFNSKELDQAIPCIWIISSINKDLNQISNACVSCLRLMKPYMKKNIDKNDPVLLRLLYLVGFIGKYCNFESNREVFFNANIGLQNDESITSLIAKYILAFCQSKMHHQIKRIAIKNLITLCGSHANLFMSEYILNIIDREVLHVPIDENLDIIETILDGINEFLKEEEEKSLKRVGLGISTSTEIALDVNIFHGKYSNKEKDGILASLAQRYMSKILELCLLDETENISIVITCAKFLETFVKQGFANPRLVISVIIALELSSINIVRSIARDLHIELHNRYESLVESKYIEGLKISSEKLGRQKAVSLEQVHVFSRFYEIISNSRASKKKFVTSLSKCFCNFSFADDDLKSCISYNNFIEFILSRLGKIELSSLEEYYILLQSIDKVVIKEGLTLQYEFRKLSETKNQSSLHESNIKLFKKVSNISLALYNLCRYKNHIMDRYSISKEKLQMFNIHKVDKDLQNSVPLLDDPCDFTVIYFADFIKLYIDDEESIISSKEFASIIYEKFIDYLYACDLSEGSSSQNDS